MHTEPLTGTRYPDTTDAPNVPQFIQFAVNDLADNTIPRFTSAAARDTAYSSWVSAGNSMVSGLTCFTSSDGRYWRYDTASSSWKYAGGNPPPIATVGAAAGWNANGGGSQPGCYMDSSGVVHLVGGVNPQTTYNPQDGSSTRTAFVLPTGYRPSTTLAGLFITIPTAANIYVTCDIHSDGTGYITGGTASSITSGLSHWLNNISFHPAYTGAVPLGMILGLDISNHQWPVYMAAVKSASRDFVVIKATEGVGFTDPRLAAHRANAHAAGLVVGLYHFARDNSPAAEAAYFAQAVGALQPGEFLVLDQEVTHTSGNVAWCAAWLDAVRARYGIAPLIYMNQGNGTGVTSGDWTSVAQTYGLWLAKYDNAPNAQSSIAYWGVPAMKQYSDAGSILGVAAPCDVDSFFGTTTQLLAYAAPSTSTGDDMTPDQDARLRNVEQILGDLQNSVNDPRIGILKGVNDVHGKVIDSVFDLSGRPGPEADDLLGHVLSLRAELRKVQTTQLDEAKLAAALLANPASVDALGKAIAAHLKLASG